ncbi:MAG: hypothetical protein ACPGED_05480, partial [Flavobacteriales bacterium]
MSILNYGDLVMSSPCQNLDEVLTWQEFIIPLNPSVGLEPNGEHIVTIVNTNYPNCLDSIAVEVSCLGIVNTEPEVIVDDLSVDTVYISTFQDVMIDHCFLFNDLENHAVGVETVVEYNDETTVFYEPGDDCICYLPPPSYIGSDTLSVLFCDNGDPILCGELTVIAQIDPFPDSNSIPYTLDGLGLPEDTLFVTTGVNQTLEYCLNFADQEGDNVSVSDWVDFSTGSNVEFEENCLTYEPPANYIGSDIILVNYCDDGTPSLCNFTWVVVEMIPDLSPNEPPHVLDEFGLPTDTIFMTIPYGIAIDTCLTIEDPNGDFAAITSINDVHGTFDSFQLLTGCFDLLAANPDELFDTLQVTICDDR